MAIQVPAFTTDQAYPFWYLRKLMSSLATPGIVNSVTDLIVSPSSGLQVQATSGMAFVQQTVNIEGSSAYNGLYFVVSDAIANPVNTISAPVSNPRIDQVILRVYDVQEQGLGGTSKGQIEWLVGTESASASLITTGPGLTNPGAATLPDNALRLAYVFQTVAEVAISSGNIVPDGGLHNWHNLTLASNYAVNSFGGTSIAVAARLERDIVRLKGGVTNNTGGNGGVNFATIPVGLRPSVTIYVAARTFNGTPISIQVGSSGGISSSGSGINYLYPNGDTINFEGATFPLN